jgi:hypothetical protein
MTAVHGEQREAGAEAGRSNQQVFVGDELSRSLEGWPLDPRRRGPRESRTAHRYRPRLQAPVAAQGREAGGPSLQTNVNSERRKFPNFRFNGAGRHPPPGEKAAKNPERNALVNDAFHEKPYFVPNSAARTVCTTLQAAAAYSPDLKSATVAVVEAREAKSTEPPGARGAWARAPTITSSGSSRAKTRTKRQRRPSSLQ